MLSKEEIIQFIQQDTSSERKRLARIGEKYYNGEHDISNYRLYYYNAEGELVEDTSRSNIKISHPFFTELIDQCAQYMISGDKFIKSDNADLQDELDKYFDDEFISELTETVTNAKSTGFGYMYGYKCTNGLLKFKNANSMGVVEVRAKDTDDKCEYIIYWYNDLIDKGTKKIKRVQVWDKNNTHYYVQEDNGDLEEDKDEPINPRPHVIYKKDNEETLYYEDLGFIPFFKLQNNKNEVSDLKPIKALIDDYDLMDCGLSNNLIDFDHPIYAVSGFPGDDLDELIQNLKTKKTIGTESGGGVDIKTVDIPYQARLTKLEIDERNIYRFGMGFNSTQLGDGNITNIVIKSRYSLLDLKCNKLEKQLKAFLRRLLKVVLDEINDKYKTDYQQKDVYFDFQREVMTNAKDNVDIKHVEAQTRQVEITTLLNLATKFDNGTIMQLICEQLDIDYNDIKDKLPKSEEELTQEADDLLNE